MNGRLGFALSLAGLAIILGWMVLAELLPPAARPRQLGARLAAVSVIVVAAVIIVRFRSVP
jgi:tellurite resistance protein TehA-like permease